ncbi:hypothetical protein L6R49_27505 [Myxococcota bacterium]|nr:hypothetical protein [Myxococcota bacterium]
MTRLSLSLLVALTACGDKETDDTATPDDTAAEGVVSYANDVWPILERDCKSCHADDSYHPGFKLIDADSSYDVLLTDAPDDASRGFNAYVVPGDAEASLLVHKIEADPSFGAQMPLAADFVTELPMSDADIQVIRDWVTAGALDN